MCSVYAYVYLYQYTYVYASLVCIVYVVVSYKRLKIQILKRKSLFFCICKDNNVIQKKSNVNYQKFPGRSPLMKMYAPKYSETPRFHSTVPSRVEKSYISVAHCPLNRMRLISDIWKYGITPII